MSAADTLPRLLWRNAERWPHRPAWRHKQLGIWQTQSWSVFAAYTGNIALGLEEQGFAAGGRLVVIGDNRPDLYAALIAAQVLGGAGVPLDSDAEAASLSAALHDSGAAMAIVDTIEQAERLRPLVDALPRPVRLFCAYAGGMQRDDSWERLSLEALAATGRARALREPGALAEAVARGSPQDLALLLYAADASPARTRPLALSHARLLTAAEAIAAADPVRPSDEALCYLPIASYDDAVYSLALGLLGGFACNCPEALDSVLRDLREIGPTILFAPPAACRALAEQVTAKAAAVTGFKRRVFDCFQKLALRAEGFREQGRPVPPSLVLGCALGEFLAYAPVRDQLGLSRTRWMHAGSTLPPETGRLLRALGVALRPGTGRVLDSASGEARETLRV